MVKNKSYEGKFFLRPKSVIKAITEELLQFHRKIKLPSNKIQETVKEL